MEGGWRQLVDPGKEIVRNLLIVCYGPDQWDACAAALACTIELLLAGLSFHGLCLLAVLGTSLGKGQKNPWARRAVVVPAVASELFTGSRCFGYFLPQTLVPAVLRSSLRSPIQQHAGHGGGGAANGAPHEASLVASLY